MSAMAIKGILVPLMFFEINEAIASTRRIDEEIAFNFDLKVASTYLEEHRLLAVSVLAQSPDSDALLPFRFRIKAVGNFMFDSDPDPELLETLKEVNCPAIIFPYIRECLADMSRRSGMNPINLPLVNFVKHRETGNILKH